MKKLLMTIVLVAMLLSSVFALSDAEKNALPLYQGSINDPSVKVIETGPEVIVVEYNGQIYIVKK